MKKFQFPLETVLRYRQQQLRTEEARLAKLQGEMSRLDLVLRGMEGERLRNKQELVEQAAADAQWLTASDTYSEVMQSREQYARQQARQGRVQWEGQQQRVLEAQRQSRLLEMMREKSLAGWRQDLGRWEDQQAAEIHQAGRHQITQREQPPDESGEEPR